ncbi:MAG TPA: B12-binding domain-containing radical SAM protein, partial [Mobilitalea sp.]|nr:B12-binding domain-containing radical SAM protein [Mobilitalea sp.]
FSCYIWNIEMITRVMVELKKVRPEAKIWFGGPEVSYDPDQCLKSYKELDGVIVGEGEQTFLELMNYYVGASGTLEQIHGLAFKSSARFSQAKEDVDDGFTMTPVRLPISLDAIPFPYEDMKQFKNKIIYYESSRGCPFTCSYCLSSIDRQVRLRNTDLVKEELEIFLNYQVPQVKFVDRTFNCNKKHAMEIWRFLKEHDNGVTNFHFEISADILDDEEIELLSTLRPGQVQFEIGVQSTNENTVTAIHRKMDLNKLARNVARIHEGANIHEHLDLIAGLPLEDFESFEKSFNDVYRMAPDQLQLGFLKVLKGSLMEEECMKYGIVYRDKAPYEVLYTKQLAYSEVLKIKGVCDMTEVYYNSGQFQYAVKYLEHFFDSPFGLYQALSNYYEEKKYDILAHSRIRRYEILLDFYEDKVLELSNTEDRKELSLVFKEILVTDVYLREDIKTRPRFALNPPEKNVSEVLEQYGVDRKAAHVEHFTYDILASCETERSVKKDYRMIFDYSMRDPLNKSAKLIEVNPING